MNYKETLAYLFTQLPMFQRIGQAAYKADLSNTYQLCELLNHPENKFKSVHIAGTNGKGSTSHMLASILQEAGYKVGLYTSPHLIDFRERIKINGEMIPEEKVVSFVEVYKKEFEKIELSFFEWTVGLAFQYFSEQCVDIAIIETGLGGRLDSTNVVTPEVAIITNIGFDHTQFLGDTLQKIAAEKAGIIKIEIPVIIGETQLEIKEVFDMQSKKLNAPILYADQMVIDDYNCDLKGVYQKKNIKTCLVAINQLKAKGWIVHENDLEKGLLNITKNTGLRGRWETICEIPKVICDTGHNESGIKVVLEQLNLEEFNQLHFVFGAVNDKSIDEILEMLPKSAQYYFCQASIPRALDVSILAEKAKKAELIGNTYKSVENALKEAKKCASNNDLVFVGGSTFVVAEALENNG